MTEVVFQEVCKKDDSLLILADLILDSYLEERKKKHIEIEESEKKDYDKDALNLRKGPF